MTIYRDRDGDEWVPEMDPDSGEVSFYCDRTGQVLNLDDLEFSYGPLETVTCGGEPR